LAFGSAALRLGGIRVREFVVISLIDFIEVVNFKISALLADADASGHTVLVVLRLVMVASTLVSFLGLDLGSTESVFKRMCRRTAEGCDSEEEESELCFIVFHHVFKLLCFIAIQILYLYPNVSDYSNRE